MNKTNEQQQMVWKTTPYHLEPGQRPLEIEQVQALAVTETEFCMTDGAGHLKVYRFGQDYVSDVTQQCIYHKTHEEAVKSTVNIAKLSLKMWLDQVEYLLQDATSVPGYLRTLDAMTGDLVGVDHDKEMNILHDFFNNWAYLQKLGWMFPEDKA